MAATLQTPKKRILSVLDVEDDGQDNIEQEISLLEHTIATCKIFDNQILI